MSVNDLPFEVVRLRNSDVFEAADDTTDENDRCVMVRKVELQGLVDEVANLQQHNHFSNIKMHNLRVVAKATTTTLASITGALAEEFNLELDTEDVNVEEDASLDEEQRHDSEEQQVPAPPQRPQQRQQPTAVAAPPQQHNRQQRQQPAAVAAPPQQRQQRQQPTAVAAPPQQRQQLTAPSKESVKRRLMASPPPAPAMKMQRRGNGNDGTTNDGNANDDTGDTEQPKKSKKPAKDKTRRDKRIVTPLGGGAVAVTWVLNDKGFISLDTTELAAKAQELLGLSTKLSKNKLKKMWQAEAAGDNDGIISDAAVGLVTHIASTHLADLAEKGPVVLQRDLELVIGEDSAHQYFDKMPEPIRTAMYYVEATLLGGQETTAQRNDLFGDVISSVKPYLDTIRQDVDFPAE